MSFEEEWAQAGSAAAARQKATADTRINSVPAERSGEGEAADYKVTSPHLKAIGNEAQELFHWFERDAFHAGAKTDTAAKSLDGDGFQTGSALWTVWDTWRSQAETLLSACAHIPGTSFGDKDLTDARTTLRIGGEAQSIMDQSRMAQIDQDYEKDSEEHKKAVGRTTEWVKFGVGAAAAGGVVALTGGAGGVLVPLAAETVGGAVVTFIGMEADDIAEKYEQDELLKKKSDDLKDEALAMGKENALRPGIAYANAPGWSERDRNYLDEELVNYVRSAREQGRDNSLPDPYDEKKDGKVT
ncbi:hypothetical protein ABZ946_19520 [Streptomyces sp. NPDC046324]|uniref:hypothetical protein n=1 Tax=Streptomyces sp. NPDC046324 TaxID=3154915 RepID=UPI003405C81A